MDEKPSKKNRLSQRDVALWKRMTGDVERAEGRDYVAVSDDEKVPAGRNDEPVRQAYVPDKLSVASAEPGDRQRGTELDRRTAERLRKGQVRPEARLDLHGMGQDQARAALHDFIAGSYERGLRCVLVITGKGRSGKRADEGWHGERSGVLKRRVPDWLREGVCAMPVLQFYKAQPRDGGDGALYVYLRRKR